MYTVYSKDNCPQCETAKMLLAAKGEQFNVLKLGADITREELLALIPTARTMPQIMKDGQLLGGLSELRSVLV